jgi:phosphatidylethanolamine-binding protein (PEBP) family uncharacterized protein
MTLSMTSATFGDNGEIPAVDTCEGEIISAPSNVSGAPENTASLALIGLYVMRE